MDWLAKAWALLHDPPYKALWPLGFRPLGGATHEEEARRLFDEVFRGTPLGGGVPDEAVRLRVARADRLAASFDRWALSETGSGYWVKPAVLINPFNGAKRPIEMPDEAELGRGVAAFIKRLNEVLSKARGAQEAYLLLYALYELEWISSGLPALPADTRMPTHTIFDHAYAAASVLNLLDDRGGVRGDVCLVEVDVPGIQRLISSARKAGDYRAGSTLVSLAVWGTVWPFMLERGPDVLISPSARFNPLLYLQLGCLGLGDALARFNEFLGKFLGLGAGVDAWFFVTQSSVMPGTAYLLLPRDDVEKVEGRFEAALAAIKDFAEGGAGGGLPLCGRGNPAGIVSNILKRAFSNAPSRYLPVRVRAVCVDEALGEAKALGDALGVEPERMIFAALMKAVKRKVAVPRAVSWFERGGVPKFEKLYDGVWLHSSLDPDQPAVLKLSGAFINGVLDFDDEAKKVLADLGVSPSELGELKKVFKPKEALGPVDLLKRALYYRLWNKIESVETVALRAHFEEGYFDGCPDLRERVELIVDGGDAEVVFGSSEAADKLLAEAPSRCGRRVRSCSDLPPPTLMYAVVRADGDWIGLVNSGCVPHRLEPPAEEVVEGDRKRWEEDRRKFEELVARAQSLRDSECRGAEEVREAGIDVHYYVPSPAYYSALSASLMLTALKDAALVSKHKGEVVFSGGDDLLAFVPLHRAFDLVEESRKSWEGNGGFHEVGKYLIPAPAAYGRSYSVRAAHAVTDFMAVEVDEAFKLLEAAKDVVAGKDALAVSTSVGHLGFAKVRDVGIMKRLACAYRLRELSRNLPYDLERAVEGGGDCSSCEGALRDLLKYIARRNTQDEAIVADLEALFNAPIRGDLWDRWNNVAELLKALREWA